MVSSSSSSSSSEGSGRQCSSTSRGSLTGMDDPRLFGEGVEAAQHPLLDRGVGGEKLNTLKEINLQKILHAFSLFIGSILVFHAGADHQVERRMVISHSVDCGT